MKVRRRNVVPFQKSTVHEQNCHRDPSLLMTTRMKLSEIQEQNFVRKVHYFKVLLRVE